MQEYLIVVSGFMLGFVVAGIAQRYFDVESRLFH